MISIYKKYHIAYWCIGVFLIICMIAVMFLFWKEKWYFPLLVFIPTILLVVVNAIVFTRLATKKLSDEVIVLINECQANNYINTLKNLFENKAKGKRTWIWIDEFSYFFTDGEGKETTRSGDFFAKVYKRIRKHGGTVTGITQNITEVLESRQAQRMLGNAEFVVLLQQKKEDLVAVTKLFDLSDSQV